MPKTTAPTAEPDEDSPQDETPDTTAEETTQDPDAKPAQPAGSEHKFFTWIRNLDLKREPGWVGGVCAGVATKLGIDPLIVRGIVVVLAVLGAPVILVYAAAWLLLPDRTGQIHLQELIRGHVTPAFPAIVGLVLLSLLPLAQGFWYLGGLYWGVPDVWGAVARALWMAVVLIVVVVLVVWLARRASGDVSTTPATTDDRPETIPVSPAATRAEAVATETAPGGPPAPPAPGASDAELAAWKQNQAEWQQERAAFVAEQQRSEQDRRQAEKQARAEEWARAAAERQRIRRLTRPRASGAAVWSIFGLALLVGAVGAFVASTRPEMGDVAWEIGIAMFTVVVGVGAVVVGLARRRAGFLAFLGIVGVLATVVGIGLPVDRELIPEAISYTIPLEEGSYARLSGTTSVFVEDAPGDAPTIDLWQATGDLVINVDQNSAVRIEAVTASGGVFVQHFADGSVVEDDRLGFNYGEGESPVTTTIGEGEPDAIIHVWLGSGSVWVLVNDEGNR
jgi:phage shock protein PspC (stress-responsive transcriptional regulator)